MGKLAVNSSKLGTRDIGEYREREAVRLRVAVHHHPTEKTDEQFYRECVCVTMSRLPVHIRLRSLGLCNQCSTIKAHGHMVGINSCKRTLIKIPVSLSRHVKETDTKEGCLVLKQ